MKYLDDIRPLVGLEEIKFGIDANGICESLGSPEVDELNHLGCRVLNYASLGLIFDCMPPDHSSLPSQLILIATTRKDSSVMGVKLMGKSAKYLQTFLEGELGAETEGEKRHWNNESDYLEDGRLRTKIEANSQGLIFWLLDGCLSSIDVWAEGAFAEDD